jgi:hypothetical protein
LWASVSDLASTAERSVKVLEIEDL